MIATNNRPVKTCLPPLALVLLAAASMCAQSATGTISGIVYAPYGSPLAGTRVWANIVSAVPRPGPNSSAATLSTVTADDGSFTLQQVPMGQYRLCAGSSNIAALNPCGWGNAPLVLIAAGRLNESGQDIRLAAGVPLHLHVVDPGGLLASNEGKVQGAALIVGLATQQGFRPFPVVGSSAASRDYEILVPPSSVQNIQVLGQYFKLSDANGLPLNAASSTPASIAVGVGATTVNWQVVGVGN